MELITPESFVAGNRNGTLQMWSLSRTGALSAKGAPINGHTEEVTSLAFLDGFSLLPGAGDAVPSTIISGSRDRTVRLWRANGNNWKESAVLQGHASEVRCVASVKEMGHIVSGVRQFFLISLIICIILPLCECSTTITTSTEI